MHKFFKKSVACIIAVLMVVSSMPFTALTANAAETKTDISVFDANNATLTEHGNRFVFADGTTNQSFTGVEWGSQVLNGGYASIDNATASFGVISSGSIGNEWSTTTMDSSGFASKGINGSHWSFSAKFAFTDTTNTASTVTIFGIGTSKTYTYSNANTYLTSGQAADLVDLRKDGTLFIGDASASATTLTASDFVSTDATSPKTVTVEYNNGSLSLSVDGVSKYKTTVTNTELFEMGVSNYFVGAPAQVYSGGNFAYYAGTSGGTARANGNKCIYGFNLYTLSGAKYEETGSTNSPAVQLKKAMKAFEDKFDGTKVYSNIEPAYNAYVAANTALNNACKTGSDADLSTAATNLEKAMKNMTAWSAYTGTKHGSFANDNDRVSADDYAETYTNVLWANSGIGADNYFTNGEEVINSWKELWVSYTYSAQTLFYYGETTLLYDGTKTPQFPVMTKMSGVNKPGTYNWNNLRMFYATISSTGFQFKENWHGNDSQFNAQWLLLSNGTGNVQNVESTSSYENKMHGKYLANILQFNQDLTNNTDLLVSYNPTIKYGVGYDKTNISSTITPSATIRVFNYKKVVTAINDNKSKLNNVANYKQGGLSDLVAAFDKATKDPNSFFSSSNDYSNCQTNYQTALNNITASPTADTPQTIQHSDDSYDWTVTKEPNCTETGLKDGVCKFCGEEVKNVEIEMLPHTWREDKEVPATCTTTGTNAGKTCTVCLATEGYGVIPVDSNAHKFTTYRQTLAPTCTAPGSEEAECDNGCGVTDSREVAIVADAHDWGEWTETLAPTCAKVGTEERICANCKKKETRDIDIVANAHAWGEWTETLAPTCAQVGTEERICANCNKKETRDIDIVADAHAWGEWVITPDKHSRVCANDPAHIDEAPHSIVKGVCVICGYKAIDMVAYDKAVTDYEAILADNFAEKYSEKSREEYLAAVTSVMKDSFASQEEVDAATSAILAAKALLVYSKAEINVYKVVDGNKTLVNTLNYNYGDKVVVDVTDKLESSEMIDKWTIETQESYVTTKLATVDKSITIVATEPTDVYVFVAEEKVNTQADVYSKVSFISKNGAVALVKYVKKDATLDTKTVPGVKIPFYTFEKWSKDVVVGTGADIEVKAIYTFDEAEENKCTVHYNGEAKKYAYDSFVYLYGAQDKTLALSTTSDESGIITYLNENAFYAPHTDEIYVIDVTSKTAKIGITGSYFTSNAATSKKTFAFNCKLYLPEGCTLVECGLIATSEKGVYKSKVETVSPRGEFTAKVNTALDSTVTSVKGKAYLTYRDADDQLVTIYSNEVVQAQ